MNKHSVGVIILVLGLLMVIGNFSGEFNREGFHSILSGVLITVVGVAFILKNKTNKGE